MAGYLGVPMLLLLGVVALRRRRSTAVRFALLLLVLVCLLALGPRPHLQGRALAAALPWALVQRLPVIANALPARGMVAADLLVAVLVAAFVEDLLGAWRRHRPAAGAATALLLVALASWAPSRPPLSTLPQPAYFTGAAVHVIAPESPALVLPYTSLGAGPRWSQSMLWQALADMRFRMPEGYFIMTDDTGRRLFTPAPTSLNGALSGIQNGQPPRRTARLRANLLRDLAALRPAAVIVGPSPVAAAERDFMTWVLGRPPQQVDGVDVWYAA
jgi:hypothetical protein